jgi:hypothetical protein
MRSTHKDLFGNDVKKPNLELTLYADEAMNRKCPYTGNNWHYICIIFERIDKSLLEDIIIERYCNNFDNSSPYYQKNNKILHWTDLSSADEKNICKRWFDYILAPHKSDKKFYCYILGLNESYLNNEEFDPKDKFGSIYNRFFRTAIEYGIKTLFPEESFSQIIIKNIYHEQGQQQHHNLFKWHPIDKLVEKTNFQFETNEIIFLPKDHNNNEQANILQLCDCFFGAVVNIIHGLENENSKRSKLKKELLDLLISHIYKIIHAESLGKNERVNNILLRFFPKQKSRPDDILQRSQNQFYSKRKLKYHEENSGQLSFYK